VISTRLERVRAHDGGAFDAFCAVPDVREAPGILLFQEIFGINDNIRGLAARLGEAGYLALAPDMFWRIEPGFERKDESGLADGMAMVQRLDFGLAAADIAAALGHLRAMPACTGKVGGVGFCLGGTLAYLLATSARADGRGPDAVVCYYGSGIDGLLNQAGAIECPIMFHYGSRDPYIPAEQIDAVEQRVRSLPVVEFHRYDAGHAFSNWDAPSLYDETAANLAWARTVAFFDRYLRLSP
jgi:carboxymethylenebutenolidase